jgi:hypothetical protein
VRGGPAGEATGGHQCARAEQAKQEADAKARAETAARQTAQKAQVEAEKRRTESEWRLYASQIALAQREWQDNEVAHARDLLDACRWDYRGWEHAYLRHLFDETQETFRGHTAFVTSVDFSPDDRRLVSGSADHTGGRPRARRLTTPLILFPLAPGRGLRLPNCSPDPHPPQPAEDCRHEGD